jgi:hypothetical protein
VVEERRQLEMTGGLAISEVGAAPTPGAPAPRGSWPPRLPEWWRGHVVAVVEGLTRTRLTQAAVVISRQRGVLEDVPRTLFGRTNSVLDCGLDATAAATLKGELALIGVTADVFDTARLLACPRALGVDEIRWDDAGIRLRTELGVHAMAWRDVRVGLLATVGDGRVPVLDLLTGRWERFRLTGTLEVAPQAPREGLPTLAKLAAAALDRVRDLDGNEALTTLSIGRPPHAPHFADGPDHEGWTTLWLARSRRSKATPRS